MTPRKRLRRYYVTHFLSVTVSCVAAEVSVFLALNYDAPNREQPVLLYLLQAPLLILLLPLAYRLWKAWDSELPPAVVHRALTPERVYTLSCCLFVLATGIGFAAEFDGTIWGILLSATLIGPLLSYAHHVGELWITLNQLHEETKTDVRLSAVMEERDELQMRIRSIEHATLWQRVRRNYPVAEVSHGD